ncbi:UNVERIFIED_CONTAM: hypothetical protein GTU68_050941 [Idotea baltica]|nr:hypothetical protein [Idotea baltica]
MFPELKVTFNYSQTFLVLLEPLMDVI